MLIYKSGQTVAAGTYWNVADGCRINAAGKAVLPGAEGAWYIRMASHMMLLAMPFIGMIYVVVMPFLGMTALVMVVCAGIPNILSGLVLRNMSFGWRPKDAYLSGKRDWQTRKS